MWCLDLRGWGYLTGNGEHCLGHGEDIAAEIQDEFGQEVVNLLNKKYG